jgi:hypothetical protein
MDIDPLANSICGGGLSSRSGPNDSPVSQVTVDGLVP